MDPNAKKTLSKSLLGSVHAYKDPRTVHEHCKPVYRSPVFGPGLVPGLDDYHHESGATYRLLRLSGTLPIAYRQTQYNIPIELWLPHDYPHVAPLLYVRPTAQMVIKQTAAVDASGKFAMNEAQRTVFGDEALVEVLKAAQRAFALDPPVYSRASATAVTAATASMSVSPAVSSTSINAGPSFQQTGYPQQQQQTYQQQPQYGYNTAASTSSPYVGYSPPQQQQFYAQQQYAQLPYAQQQMHYAQQQQQHQQQAYAYGNAYTQNQQTGSGTYHPGASNMISPQHSFASSIGSDSPSPTPMPMPVPSTATSTSFTSPHLPSMLRAASSTSVPSTGRPSGSTMATSYSATPTSPIDATVALSSLRSAAYDKIRRYVQEVHGRRMLEVGRERAACRRLVDAHATLSRGIEKLTEEASRTRAATAALKEHMTTVQRQLQASTTTPQPSVDDLLQHPTVVHEQLHTLVAEDEAMQDAIYVLGKALHSGRLALPVFLKAVRAVACEQFMGRALLLKVRRVVDVVAASAAEAASDGK